MEQVSILKNKGKQISWRLQHIADTQDSIVKIVGEYIGWVQVIKDYFSKQQDVDRSMFDLEFIYEGDPVMTNKPWGNGKPLGNLSLANEEVRKFVNLMLEGVLTKIRKLENLEKQIKELVTNGFHFDEKDLRVFYCNKKTTKFNDHKVYYIFCLLLGHRSILGKSGLAYIPPEHLKNKKQLATYAGLINNPTLFNQTVFSEVLEKIKRKIDGTGFPLKVQEDSDMIELMRTDILTK